MLASHRAAVVARPEDQAAFNAWLTDLRESGLGEQAVREALAELQDEHQAPIPTVLVHLVTHDREQTYRDRFAGHLSAFAESPAALDCREVWGQYGRLLPLDADACARVTVLRPAAIQLSFLTASPRFRRVRLFNAAPWTRGGDADFSPVVEWSDALPDVDKDVVRTFAEAFLEPPEPAGPDGTDHRQFASDTARWVVEHYERYIAFQERAVRAGNVAFADPLQPARAPLAPFDGVVVFDRTVYSYAGQELYQLIAGGAGSRVVGVYLAVRNVLIDLEANLPRVVSEQLMANLFSQLLLRLARNPDGYHRGLTLSREAEQEGARPARSVVLGLGRAQNFAHHLWNYFPGFERLADLGLADRVSEVHSAGSEFFGPVEGVFPEFAHAVKVRNRRQALWDPYPFSPDHLVVQPGGYFITRGLIERLVTTMQALPASDPVTAQPEFGHQRPFPIVWIGMRVGSRSWSDQEHDIPRLTSRLLEHYPDALFVLDGFSFPVGQDDVSRTWSAAVEQLRELAAAVIGASPRPDRVISLVGNTLRESVLWAREVDTYLAPLGTSQHKVGWFTAAPGAAYGPASLVELGIPARRYGAWEAEGTTVPVYVIGESIDSGRRRRASDRREFLDNVRLEHETLVTTMCELIEQRRRQLGA